MSVLSKTTILKLCADVQLVQPYKEVNVFSSSYDLEVGDEYYVCSEEKVNIATLGVGEKFLIPPYKVCFVISEEKINVPTNLCALVSLKSEFVQKGLVLSSQPPIDGGYQGKIFALLHNLTNRSIQLQRGTPFLSMVFHELNQEGPIYTGEYQGMTSLRQLKYLEPFESALKELEIETKRVRDRYEMTLPGLLRVVTIIVATLAIILTILTVSGIVPIWSKYISPSCSNPSITSNTTPTLPSSTNP